jgi:hypothetical protein
VVAQVVEVLAVTKQLVFTLQQILVAVEEDQELVVPLLEATVVRELLLFAFQPHLFLLVIHLMVEPKQHQVQIQFILLQFQDHLEFQMLLLKQQVELLIMMELIFITFLIHQERLHQTHLSVLTG